MRIVINGKVVIDDVANILLSDNNLTVFLRKEGKLTNEQYVVGPEDVLEIKIF